MRLGIEGGRGCGDGLNLGVDLFGDGCLVCFLELSSCGRWGNCFGVDSSLFVVLRCCFGTLCSGECGRYFRERLASHVPENFGR